MFDNSPLNTWNQNCLGNSILREFMYIKFVTRSVFYMNEKEEKLLPLVRSCLVRSIR